METVGGGGTIEKTQVRIQIQQIDRPRWLRSVAVMCVGSWRVKQRATILNFKNNATQSQDLYTYEFCYETIVVSVIFALLRKQGNNERQS